MPPKLDFISRRKFFGRRGGVMAMQLSGAEKMWATLDALGGGARTGAAEAMYTLATEVMRDSQKRVPVDTGLLKSTGYVSFPSEQSNKIYVDIGYGGPADHYAVIVHEDLTMAHPRGGEAKYLERAVDAVATDRNFDSALRSSVFRDLFEKATATQKLNNPALKGLRAIIDIGAGEFPNNPFGGKGL